MTFIETHSIQFLNLINAFHLWIQSYVVSAPGFYRCTAYHLQYSDSSKLSYLKKVYFISQQDRFFLAIPSHLKISHIFRISLDSLGKCEAMYFCNSHTIICRCIISWPLESTWVKCCRDDSLQLFVSMAYLHSYPSARLVSQRLSWQACWAH